MAGQGVSTPTSFSPELASTAPAPNRLKPTESQMSQEPPNAVPTGQPPWHRAGKGKWTETPEGQIECSAHTDVRRATIGKSTDPPPHFLKIALSLLVIYVATLSARTT